MNQQIPSKEKLVALFSKHLVPIHFHFKKNNNDHHVVISSFVISIKNAWFLVTAGHCLREIKDNIEKYGATLSKSQLIDYGGMESKFFQPIPFDFMSSHNAHLKDDKYDYGIIYIEDYYKRLLQSNNVMALNEEVWDKQPHNPDFHFLLGVPSRATDMPGDKLNIKTSFNYVEQCQTKPEGFDHTDAPTFYGKVRLDEQISSIEGMSGGPIFSFKKTESGDLKYWLCAVQSRWIKSEKLIAACLMKPFISLVKSLMEGKIQEK